MRRCLGSRLLVLIAGLGIAAGPSLEPVPHPTPEAMEDSVRRRAEELRSEVDRLLAADPLPAGELGQALGRLGRFYQTHQFFDAGAAALRNAVSLTSDPRWHYALGVLYQDRGDLDPAAESFREAIDRAPEEVAPRIRLGRVELKRGRLEAAAEAFRAALDREAGDAAALEGLGRVAQLEDRHEDAVGRFRKALSLQPDADRLRHRLGISLRALGDLEAAKPHLQAAGTRGPGFPEPWLEPVELDSLGSLQRRATRAMRAGRPQAAAATMRKVLARRPGDPTAMRALAAALLETGETGEAFRLYRRAAEADPGNPAAHAELGQALLVHSRATEALAPLRRAVELDPRNAGFRIALARALLEEGRPEEALERSREAAEIDPVSTEASRQAARILTELGRTEEAATELEALVSAGGAEPSDLLSLAALHLQAAEPRRAETVLRRAIRQDPDSPTAGRAHRTLGNLRLQAGAPEEAVAHFRSALEIDPDLSDLRLDLGLALLQARQPEDAIPVLETLVRERPDPLAAELLAMALGAVGRTAEAATLQERILEAAEAGGAPSEVLRRLRANLERYRKGEPPARLP